MMRRCYRIEFKAFCLGLLLLNLLMLNACSFFKVGNNEEKKPEQLAQQIFENAEQSLAKKNYTSAIKSYESLDALYPFNPYAEKALLDNIYAYYQSGDYASANAASARFVHHYPANPHVDYAWYMKGLSAMLQDRTWPQRYLPIDLASRDSAFAKNAFEDFAELIRQFPHSAYALDARQRMIYLKNIFAQKELNIAKFYFRKKAYVAAANRASEVLEHYNGTQAQTEALEMLIKSYTALGQTEQADKARRMLKYNQYN